MGQGKFEKQKKQSKTNKILLRVMVVVLSVLLVLMIVTAVAMNYVLGKIGRFDEAQQTEAYSGDHSEFFETDPTEEGQENYATVDPNEIVWGDVGDLSNENIINILLVGNDARPGESRARSDTMILVSLNKKTNAIGLTSFMRDMYVRIPGYYDNRINVAFALGGPDLLCETLKANFGVEVDGTVEVNFEAFSDVIDAIGGVDVEMTASEASYMRGRGFSASEGVSHMDGEAALVFARVRSLAGSDYNRTDRQRRVIAAVIESMKGSSVKELMGLIDTVLPMVTTDLTDAQIVNYATTGLTALGNGGQIQSARIPADDAHYNAMISGMAVLVPDLEMCQEDLQEFIYND